MLQSPFPPLKSPADAYSLATGMPPSLPNINLQPKTSPNVHSGPTISARSQPAYSTPSLRWSALTTRDPSSANAFIYGVRSTGCYCLPTCPARLARRANVVFFDDTAQAERAGYRACKRCKPDRMYRKRGQLQSQSSSSASELGTGNNNSPSTAVDDGTREDASLDPDDVWTKIRLAVRLVRESALNGTAVTLSQLSKEVGLSKWHLHRVFKRLQGVTPREMAESIQNKNNGLQSAVPDVPDLPVLSCDKTTDLQLIGDDGPGYDFSSWPATSMVDPHMFLTTPSMDDGLTPERWLDDPFYDPTLFTVDRGTYADGDVEGLLNVLFPELYQEKTTLGMHFDWFDVSHEGADFESAC